MFIENFEVYGVRKIWPNQPPASPARFKSRSENPPPDQAEAIANLAERQKLVPQSQARPQDAKPAAEPASSPAPGPTIPVAPLTEQQRQAMWAAAMTNMAGEVTASPSYLPPAERKVASIRAAALSSCASHLLSGAPPSAFGARQR